MGTRRGKLISTGLAQNAGKTLRRIRCSSGNQTATAVAGMGNQAHVSAHCPLFALTLPALGSCTSWEDLPGVHRIGTLKRERDVMESMTLPPLRALEECRGNPLILYVAPLEEMCVRVLYECLRTLGKQERLDVVLATNGGTITTAHQVARLLREYAHHLTILVPYRALSAGTLLCLCADELVLGPMSALGPIDAHIGAAGFPPPDAPTLISAQDVRAFREMAEQWFGVVREEDRLQILALVAQRIFPTSLSAFYRSDQLTRQIANELLAYQLPDVDTSIRQHIVDRLAGGYFAHDYVISRHEARSLGLRVRFASQQEEVLLWEVLQTSRPSPGDSPTHLEGETTAVIASSSFSARLLPRWVDVPAARHKTVREGESTERTLEVHWDIERKGDGDGL